jgi:hypothetical protein
MAYSQSGYPDIADYGDPRLVSNPTVPGTDVRILGGLLAGDVCTILLYVAARYNAEVQKLQQVLGCWGLDPEHNNYVSDSNHESATAMDLNAVRHPIGTDPASNYTGAQIDAVHRILTACIVAGVRVVRWGGDYTGRKDGMHFEINDGLHGDPVVAELAARIRAGKVPNVPAELRDGAPTPAPAPKPGGPPVKPASPKPQPPEAPAFPLKPGQYYGPLEGPANSISGLWHSDTDAERKGLATWQQRMADRGWRIDVDGYYGPQTAGVCRSFQREKHLAVDGLIGPHTWVAAWTEPVT